MAAPLLYHIEFELKENMPRIETVLINVMDITGLSIVATSKLDGVRNVIWIIKAKQKGLISQDAMVVEIMDNCGGYVIVSNVFSKRAPYLVGSILYVLKQLGGEFKDIIPGWAGKPWETVKHSWNPSIDYIETPGFF